MSAFCASPCLAMDAIASEKFSVSATFDLMILDQVVGLNLS